MFLLLLYVDVLSVRGENWVLVIFLIFLIYIMGTPDRGDVFLRLVYARISLGVLRSLLLLQYRLSMNDKETDHQA